MITKSTRAFLVCLIVILNAGLAYSKSSNEVAGLKLPASATVQHDEGFITITADCKGDVRWLVLSTAARVKYKVVKATEIIVAVPIHEAIVTIYAVLFALGWALLYFGTFLPRGAPTP